MVNARKHAHARHVVLDLHETDSTVTARLTDAGDGAQSMQVGPGHLGMATIRARTHTEGGRLDITSKAAKPITRLRRRRTTRAGEHRSNVGGFVPNGRWMRSAWSALLVDVLG